MLVLLTVENYVVLLWTSFKWHYTHSKCHENPISRSRVVRRDTDKRQYDLDKRRYIQTDRGTVRRGP